MAGFPERVVVGPAVAAAHGLGPGRILDEAGAVKSLGLDNAWNPVILGSGDGCDDNGKPSEREGRKAKGLG